MLIIPAIDLKDGKCVRLKQGVMNDSTIFADNPCDMASKWVSYGAKRLHLVDLNGAFKGSPVNADCVREISAKFPNLPIQIGGGIRSLDIANSYIEAGISYLIIGTMAVNNYDFVIELCREFPDKIIIGLDANNGFVATNGWAKQTKISVIELAKKFEQAGVNAIIYTDIARDGMLKGVNVSATVKLAKSTNIPIIASGGITNLDDINALLEYSKEGIIGAITGRAIYEGSLDFKEAQKISDNYDY